MRQQSKAIFVGGTSKSGKTQLRFMLDHHSELTSFAGADLLTWELFRRFPEWLHDQPRSVRVAWVDAYRRVSLTRFLCFRKSVKDTRATSPWWKVNRSWMRRFREPHATWWDTPWGVLAERLWLTGVVQSRRQLFRPPTRRNGYRGLGFPDASGPGLDRRLIERHLGVLDALVDAKSVESIYEIYGRFWSQVFDEFARQANKRYWIKESTGAVVHSPFLERVFGSIKVIHVVRDGRDVAWERVRIHGGLKADTLEKWRKKVERNESALRMLKPESGLTVHYEDLVRDQRATLHKVMAFLGLKFEDSLLRHRMTSDRVGIHRRSTS